jgi:hypothetical protein
VKTRDGYVLVRQPGHPRAGGNGYVKRSILVWEEAHGRPVPEGVATHHVNGIRDDDRPENLLVLTPSEHSKLHHLLGWGLENLVIPNWREINSPLTAKEVIRILGD